MYASLALINPLIERTRDESLNCGLPTKVTFKAAMFLIGISFGRDCNEESSFTIPSLNFFEMAFSTAEDNLPSKASINLKVKEGNHDDASKSH